MGLQKSIVGEQAPVNEVVNFLHRYGGEEIERLKRQYPGFSEVFQQGITLGESESEDERLELKVRMELCKSGLQLILEKATQVLPKIKSNLKMLNNVQLASQGIVVISGASILAFLREMHGNSIKILIGCLTLLGALLSLFVQHRSGTIVPGDNSLSKIFNDLTDHKLRAEHLFKELLIVERTHFSSSTEEVFEIIQQSNEISLKMKRLIEKL